MYILINMEKIFNKNIRVEVTFFELMQVFI